MRIDARLVLFAIKIVIYIPAGNGLLLPFAFLHRRATPGLQVRLEGKTSGARQDDVDYAE
jgi:hypothetical protein